MRTPKLILSHFASFLIVIVVFFVQVPVTVYAEENTAKTIENTTLSGEKTIYFPQFQPMQSVVNEDYMLSRIVGKLALSDECLRIVLGDRSYLLIWPGWYAFDIVNRDIVVTHLRTRSAVANMRLGDTLSLIGGELEDRPYVLKYSIPRQCKGPYLAVGDIESIQTKTDLPKPEKSKTSPENKPSKPDKQLKDSKKSPNAIHKGSHKTSKGLSKPVKEPQKMAKPPQKSAKNNNKPSNNLDEIDVNIPEESILK